ncbi:hypothetical protein P3S68_008928 [Capsicum galapagoense]
MAHASVASLMRTIESLLTSNSPMQSLIRDHREELCALREKVSSLEVFLKNFEKNNVSGEMTDFEVEVKEVASAAENTFQLRLTETFRKSFRQLAKDIDHVRKESTKIQDKGKQASKELLVHDCSSSTDDILNVNNNMVGCDDQKERLLEDLIGSYSGEPKVIPIHNIKEILQTLLKSTIKMDDTVKTEVEAELADMLQKSLKRKRYLIVLDDIWSVEVWDGMSRCFPTDENVGSRILLTTRNNEVARNAGTKNLSMQMNFMDQDESWNLFKSAAFSNEALSSLFETIGKQIAEKCYGLPLTIVVVAGLLKSKRAIEDWGSVSKDVTSLITNDPDEQCSHVLGLSYNHLTSDLKTCLLHFGIFPEDSEVPAKRLVRSWMAEGFLKLENDLEGEAEKCLQELVDRCLVLVCKKSLDGTKNRSYSERRYLTMQKMQPFKCVTGDKIGYCPHGLYRALLTPVHHQLRDHDNNDLMKRTPYSFQITQSLGVEKHRYGSFPSTDSKPNLVEEFIMRIQKVKELGISAYQIDSDGPLNKAEVLKLMHNACLGEEWYPNVRGFTRLKFLLIKGNRLKHWKVTDDNFPILERLVLKECYNLKEIPIEFAEIHTLQLIELSWCLPKLGESAARIQKQQEDLGNNLSFTGSPMH